MNEQDTKSRATFKEWLKQFLCVSVSAITLLSPISEVYASDYKKQDDDGSGATYYISDKKDFNSLFDFSLYDVPDIANWILDFRTYVVVKNYTNKKGENVYKCYFNTPNLQTIVKNEVINSISDGYTDSTYNINDTQRIIDVGENASEVNAITKYGFKVPSYTYMGEYPKELMSPAGILPSPKKWYEVLWTAIKAIFGVSFLKAPDASSFNSLKYINHGYVDKSDYILEYFQNYYLKYFEAQTKLCDENLKPDKAYDLDKKKCLEYFTSPEQVLELTVTKDAEEKAEKYVDKYEDEYKSSLEHYYVWKHMTQNEVTVDNPDTRGMCSNTDWWNTDKYSLQFKEYLDEDGAPLSVSTTNINNIFDTSWDNVIKDNKAMINITDQIYHVGEKSNRYLDMWHFFASREAFKKKFYTWLTDPNATNTNTAYVFMSNVLGDLYIFGNSVRDDNVGMHVTTTSKTQGNTKKNKDITFRSPSDYGLDPNSKSFDTGENDEKLVALAADLNQFAYESAHVGVEYYKQQNTGKRTIYKTDTDTDYKTYVEYTIHYKDGGTANKSCTYNRIKVSQLPAGGGWKAYTQQGTDQDHPAFNDANVPFTFSNNWVDIERKTRNTLYKDEEHWLFNPDNYVENPYPDSPIQSVTSTSGGQYYSIEDEREWNNCNISCTDSVKWFDYCDYILGDISDWSNIDHVVINHIKSYNYVTKLNYKREDTVNQYRDSKFKFLHFMLYNEDVDNPSYKITDVNALRNFEKEFNYDKYNINVPYNNGSSGPFTVDDIWHPDLHTIYDNYNHSKDLIAKYKKFNRLMARGTYDNTSKTVDAKDLSEVEYIPYRQCLIFNTGKDGECVSQKFGNGDTTITVANAIVYSGIYKITEEYRKNDYALPYNKLSYEDAHELLTQLQVYCGPYYDDVLVNMMKLMAASAQKEGNKNPSTSIIEDDPRVMPYDTSNMLRTDKNNLIADPRVTIYKGHAIGRLIGDLQVDPAIGIFIKPQKTIINIAGLITEVSVFLQEICTFDFLDSLGLSPTKMWKNVYVSLMMIAVVIFFIVKTVIAVIKMGSKSLGKVAIGMLLLILELGMFTAISASPEKTWNSIKSLTNKLSGTGELVTVATQPNLTYLFGSSKDYEVAYYLPYLDCWSTYNTGYGLNDSAQLISDSRDKVELEDFENPGLDGNDIKHWSVLLMDSFEYHGNSKSLLNSVQENGVVMNGPYINNNAYRVVDHYLAPRVNVSGSGDTVSLGVTQNENYNGEFQSGIFNVIIKLVNCCLICFLSLVKMLIFIYFWWKMYIFIFSVILGMAAERKKMSDILKETFTPLLAFILFGVYAGICISVCLTATGVFCLALDIFLFWLTTRIVVWWHDAGRKSNFPFTLSWLYFLATMRSANRASKRQELEDESIKDAANAGIDFDEEELQHFDKRTEKLFNPNGTMKTEYAIKYRDETTGENMGKVYDDWYKWYLNKKNLGHTFSEQELAAVRQFETSELTKDKADELRRTYQQDASYNRSKFNNNNHKKPDKIKRKDSDNENTNSNDTSTEQNDSDKEKESSHMSN